MRYAVIGAGCGGQAMAGYLASRGHDVSLYNRSADRLEGLVPDLTITLDGEVQATGRLRKASTDIASVVADADLIMVVTTATGHTHIAKEMAPYLSDAQTVVLNPGRTLGAGHLLTTLRAYGCEADVTIAEANTLIYATRLEAPGKSRIFGVKEKVTLSTLPSGRADAIVARLRPDYPQFEATDHVLTTSMGNIGAVFHPTIMYANAERIRRGERFEFYREGATPYAVSLLEQVDAERLRLARALDVEVPGLLEWLCGRYALEEADLGTALRCNPAYQNIPAPDSFDTRYLWEDVPTGLVPFSELGRVMGIRMERTDEIIRGASALLGRDLRRGGRGIESLGYHSLIEPLARSYARMGDGGSSLEVV